ncbi:uncharacterized protein [Amphiura filiformis]|uniref:uncharacterized protein isoform X2 n=1 Tax=Amphiura filiformis TaxID=82378 RepID=UPI003B21E64C
MTKFVVLSVTLGLFMIQRTTEAQVTCASNEFACANGLICVPQEFQCDSFADCDDNSDELGCLCDLEYAFQCEGGGCVNQTWVCDGRADCFDGSDEAEEICSKQTVEAGNECLSNPCSNGATCEDGIDSYTCSCTSGWTGDTCQQNINECLSRPCQNRGRCVDGIGRHRCICRRGWTGMNCEARFNPCISEPCQNGGTCKGTVNAYTCQCLPGWTGVNCDIATCAGDEFACTDGSACVPAKYYCDYLPDCNDNSDESRCACNTDYEFECTSGGCIYDTWVCDGVDDCFDTSDEASNLCNASGKTNECASSPCQNDGQCEDGFGRYTCICESSWAGINCEIYIYECRSRPCLNGGRCEDQVNGYTCICQPGWNGINCERTGMEPDNMVNAFDQDGEHIDNPVTPPTDIDECASEPCTNEATCEDGISGYICRCIAGYMGTNCEQGINECDSMPCLNGGLCVDDINGYRCQCLPGWRGTLCEIYWSDWSAWSSCSRSCDSGRESRTRHCVGGYSCVGSPNEERDCNTQICPHWSDWRSWSSCSRSCGGGRESRSRYCIGGPSCQGSTNEERNCNTQICPHWSSWSSWDSCSESCGGGSRKRTRSCLGGYSCIGSHYEDERCNTDRCACPTGWSAFDEGNYCYRYVSSRKTFNAAKEYCVDQGAKLVRIFSSGENDFVKRRAGGNQAWIGLSRHPEEGRYEGAYVWIGGIYAGYTNWDSGQPSYEYFFAEELCVVMRTNGKWNDFNCAAVHPFVCKKIVRNHGNSNLTKIK